MCIYREKWKELKTWTYLGVLGGGTYGTGNAKLSRYVPMDTSNTFQKKSLSPHIIPKRSYTVFEFYLPGPESWQTQSNHRLTKMCDCCSTWCTLIACRLFM